MLLKFWWWKVRYWWCAEAEWYEFWMPQSGWRGGCWAGLLVFVVGYWAQR